MFDCQPTGDDGAKEALWLFAQQTPDLHVRLMWSQTMHGGQFSGRQPESLTGEESHEFLLPAWPTVFFRLRLRHRLQNTVELTNPDSLTQTGTKSGGWSAPRNVAQTCTKVQLVTLLQKLEWRH